MTCRRALECASPLALSEIAIQSKAPEGSAPYTHPPASVPAAANPEGTPAQSPGLRASELPWENVRQRHQPRRGCGLCKQTATAKAAALSGLALHLTRGPRVARRLATLGFENQSLRDWVRAGALQDAAAPSSFRPPSFGQAVRQSRWTFPHRSQIFPIPCGGDALAWGVRSRLVSS